MKNSDLPRIGEVTCRTRNKVTNQSSPIQKHFAVPVTSWLYVSQKVFKYICYSLISIHFIAMTHVTYTILRFNACRRVPSEGAK